MTTATRIRPLTVKQEAYCLRLFKGENQREAYIAVYHPRGSLASIDVAASELAHLPKVMVRLRELRDALESPDIADVKERKQRLTEIMRARLTDFVEVGEQGADIKIDLKSANSAALSEVVTKKVYSKVKPPTQITSVKLHNPVTAIDTLNRMDKIYGDSAPPGGITINADKVIVDARGKIAELLERRAGVLNGEG